MQVAAAAQRDADALNFDLGNVTASAQAAAQMPGMDTAAAELGYQSLDALQRDIEKYYELVPLLSEFCLTPPGDMLPRRGLFEALLMGCVPVLFHEGSAEYPWYFSEKDRRDIMVFFDPDSLSNDMHELPDMLRKLLPQIVNMRARIVQLATTLQYSYADPAEADVDRIGPDALDVALYRMSIAARNVTTRL